MRCGGRQTFVTVTPTPHGYVKITPSRVDMKLLTVAKISFIGLHVTLDKRSKAYKVITEANFEA